MSDGITWNDDSLRRMFLSDPVGESLAIVATNVEATAKRLCPVDTGRLRSSISWVGGEDGEGLYAEVGSNVEYAIPVEFRQPFLRPALYENTGVV